MKRWIRSATPPWSAMKPCSILTQMSGAIRSRNSIRVCRSARICFSLTGLNWTRGIAERELGEKWSKGSSTPLDSIAAWSSASHSLCNMRGGLRRILRLNKRSLDSKKENLKHLVAFRSFGQTVVSCSCRIQSFTRIVRNWSDSRIRILQKRARFESPAGADD